MTRGRRSLGRKAVSVAVHSTLGHALTTIWNLVADMAFCCQFGIIYLAILVKYSGFTQNQTSVLSKFVKLQCAPTPTSHVTYLCKEQAMLLLGQLLEDQV